jgi:hypothetical protein
LTLRTAFRVANSLVESKDVFVQDTAELLEQLKRRDVTLANGSRRFNSLFRKWKPSIQLELPETCNTFTALVFHAAKSFPKAKSRLHSFAMMLEHMKVDMTEDPELLNELKKSHD